MKKLIALVMALVMALSLTTVAWGATEHTVNSVSEWDALLAGSTVAAGDTIKLAAGDYSQLSFPVGAPTNLTVVGGEGVTVGKVFFYALNNVRKPCPDGLTLQNITFDPAKLDSANDSEYNGLGGVEANNTTVTGLSILGCTFNNGAVVRMPKQVTDIKIDGCTFNGVAVASVEQNIIYFQKLDSATITNNKFYGADFNAINATSGSVTGEITITGNIINGTASRAIRLSNVDANADVEITGNQISNTNTDPAEATANAGEVIKASGVTTGATFEVSGNTMPADAKVVVAPIVDDAIEVTIDTNGKVTAGEFYSEPTNIADGLTYLNGTLVPASSVGANILSGNYFVKGTNAGATAGAAVVSVTEAKAPKDANKNGTIDAGEVGNVKYYNIAGYTTKFVQVASVSDADMIVYYGNTEAVFAYLKGVPAVEYYGTGVAFNNFGEKCGQVDYEPETGVKYYSFENVVYETSKTAATRYLMVGTELVGVKALGVAPNAHVAAFTYDKDYKVTAIKCAECGTSAALYANWASVPKTAQTVAVALGDGRYYVWAAGPVAGDVVVESAETFDAGIAMYVGMSIMAATGAVVLKKKD